MRKLVFLGVSSLLATQSWGKHPVHCEHETEAEKTAKGLDKIYEEPVAARTPAELEAYLQTQSRVSG